MNAETADKVWAVQTARAARAANLIVRRTQHLMKLGHCSREREEQSFIGVPIKITWPRNGNVELKIVGTKVLRISLVAQDTGSLADGATELIQRRLLADPGLVEEILAER